MFLLPPNNIERKTVGSTINKYKYGKGGTLSMTRTYQCVLALAVISVASLDFCIVALLIPFGFP